MEQNQQSRPINKDFLLTDNSVNSYGFRLLTEGYMQEEFEKNPIGYYMHLREEGVVVRWTDFRRDGDKVFAKPVINMSNTRGGQTYDEVINGFLNAASVGHYVILELSDDASLKLPGQTGPTVTKWYNRELSLVDIPGNYNALTNLFDKDGNKINALSDLVSTAKTTTTHPTAAPHKKSYEQKRIDTLSNMSWHELDRSGKLEELKKLSEDAYEEKFRDEFGKYPDSRKNRLKDAKPETGKKEKDEYQKKRLETLSAKSWDELDRSGDMVELKQLSETAYRAKVFENFGVYPTT
ncbi:MAG: hypothetical protein DI598_14065 [Pseudopedobacter saltans]|uniref:Uncharacterized protein n=1 Tax=Pseudopedobacter saltans TaxID=151895 RepID=A0A2W5EL95_9SPHI|nr:MAG: hypothetical protein DI598_14065 [Pseudopedobacter saltans]